MKLLDWLIGGPDRNGEHVGRMNHLALSEQRSIDAHECLMVELRRLEEQLRQMASEASDDDDGRQLH